MTFSRSILFLFLFSLVSLQGAASSKAVAEYESLLAQFDETPDEQCVFTKDMGNGRSMEVAPCFDEQGIFQQIAFTAKKGKVSQFRIHFFRSGGMGLLNKERGVSVGIDVLRCKHERESIKVFDSELFTYCYLELGDSANEFVEISINYWEWIKFFSGFETFANTRNQNFEHIAHGLTIGTTQDTVVSMKDHSLEVSSDPASYVTSEVKGEIRGLVEATLKANRAATSIFTCHSLDILRRQYEFVLKGKLVEAEAFDEGKFSENGMDVLWEAESRAFLHMAQFVQNVFKAEYKRLDPAENLKYRGILSQLIWDRMMGIFVRFIGSADLTTETIQARYQALWGALATTKSAYMRDQMKHFCDSMLSHSSVGSYKTRVVGDPLPEQLLTAVADDVTAGLEKYDATKIVEDLSHQTESYYLLLANAISTFLRHPGVKQGLVTGTLALPEDFFVQSFASVSDACMKSAELWHSLRAWYVNNALIQFFTEADMEKDAYKASLYLAANRVSAMTSRLNMHMRLSLVESLGGERAKAFFMKRLKDNYLRTHNLQGQNDSQISSSGKKSSVSTLSSKRESALKIAFWTVSGVVILVLVGATLYPEMLRR